MKLGAGRRRPICGGVILRWRCGRMRLEQVGVRVTSLTRSLRFYTRGLGLKVVARGDTRGWGGGMWVQLRDPRSRPAPRAQLVPKGLPFRRTVPHGGLARPHRFHGRFEQSRAAREGVPPPPPARGPPDGLHPEHDGGLDGERPRSRRGVDHDRATAHPGGAPTTFEGLVRARRGQGRVRIASRSN